MRENYLEALKWYGKAADMGNAEAKYKIGKILWEEGKRYLQESWEQGNADAGTFIKENLRCIEENDDCGYLVFKSPKPFSISSGFSIFYFLNSPAHSYMSLKIYLFIAFK